MQEIAMCRTLWTPHQNQCNLLASIAVAWKKPQNNVNKVTCGKGGDNFGASTEITHI